MKLFAYLVVILVILGALFVAFKPQRSSAPSTPSAVAVPPDASTGASTTGASTTGASTTGATPSQQAPVAAQPSAKVFVLEVKGGRLVAGPAVIQVSEGDEVTLRLKADTADELHLHGYDLRLKTRPGETVSIDFPAKRTGRFGFELHHSGLELGALEVYPR